MKKIWKIFWGVIFLAVCSGCGIKKEQVGSLYLVGEIKDVIRRNKK